MLSSVLGARRERNPFSCHDSQNCVTFLRTDLIFCPWGLASQLTLHKRWPWPAELSPPRGDPQQHRRQSPGPLSVLPGTRVQITGVQEPGRQGPLWPQVKASVCGLPARGCGMPRPHVASETLVADMGHGSGPHAPAFGLPSPVQPLSASQGHSARWRESGGYGVHKYTPFWLPISRETGGQ